jgi:hypothetical protein
VKAINQRSFRLRAVRPLIDIETRKSRKERETALFGTMKV